MRDQTPQQERPHARRSSLDDAVQAAGQRRARGQRGIEKRDTRRASCERRDQVLASCLLLPLSHHITRETLQQRRQRDERQGIKRGRSSLSHSLSWLRQEPLLRLLLRCQTQRRTLATSFGAFLVCRCGITGRRLDVGRSGCKQRGTDRWT